MGMKGEGKERKSDAAEDPSVVTAPFEGRGPPVEGKRNEEEQGRRRESEAVMVGPGGEADLRNQHHRINRKSQDGRVANPLSTLRTAQGDSTRRAGDQGH